uniref:ATP synthase F0 subunit 8 n=2 Tax=Sephisa princeps TaxID=396723 RepID=C4B8M4_9NEOP|nr:ATP synthase F0 subunit 8 [Sephisa princeps]
MMPINWILSFIFFISIFLTFMIMNYYIFNCNNNLMKKNKLIKNIYILTWKW